MTGSDHEDNAPGIPMAFLENETEQRVYDFKNDKSRDETLKSIKSVQRNLKLMWLCQISLLLIFAVGFVALHFSISTKIEGIIEGCSAKQQEAANQQISNKNIPDDQFKLPQDNLHQSIRNIEIDLKSIRSKNFEFQGLVQHNLSAMADSITRMDSDATNTKDLIQQNMLSIANSLAKLENGATNAQELLQNSSTNTDRDLQKVKEELDDMKDLLPRKLSTITTSINSIQNASQSFTRQLQTVKDHSKIILQSIANNSHNAASFRKDLKDTMLEISNRTLANLETRDQNTSALYANFLHRLNTATDNIGSIETILTALKGQLERNLTSVSSHLESIQAQHANYREELTQNITSISSKVNEIQTQNTGYEDTLLEISNQTRANCKTGDQSTRALYANCLQLLNTTTSTIGPFETTLSTLKDTPTTPSPTSSSADVQCPIQGFSFVELLSSSASRIFPRSLTGYYKFVYDGSTNYSIGDGGRDMYDTGNRLHVWKSRGSKVQVYYNWTYSDPDGDYLVVCKALHPFVVSMLILNRDGASRQYFIQEEGNLGADGSGNYRWNSGSLTAGTYNIQYLLYQVYGTSDPSIIQIFFTASSPKLGSSGSSSLSYTDYEKNTRMTNNRVALTGTAHNFYFNYILTAIHPSSLVQTSIIERILRETFQDLLA